MERNEDELLRVQILLEFWWQLACEDSNERGVH